LLNLREGAEAEEEADMSVGIHHLKTWPSFFEQILDGRKRFELRRDDRGYQTGDTLMLHEWDPQKGSTRQAEGYTGRTLQAAVTCIIRSEDLAGFAPDALGPGFVILGIRLLSRRKPVGAPGEEGSGNSPPEDDDIHALLGRWR
jgi:hypothetical protein